MLPFLFQNLLLFKIHHQCSIPTKWNNFGESDIDYFTESGSGLWEVQSMLGKWWQISVKGAFLSKRQCIQLCCATSHNIFIRLVAIVSEDVSSNTEFSKNSEFSASSSTYNFDDTSSNTKVSPTTRTSFGIIWSFFTNEYFQPILAESGLVVLKKLFEEQEAQGALSRSPEKHCLKCSLAQNYIKYANYMDNQC